MVEFLEGLFARPAELHGFEGMIQLLILMAAYGYGLGRASLLISKGTEMLMVVPEYTGLIGSVLLPILGAVPDGAFILFSGLGPNAQDELSVGVGALAGSTVLLVTVTWAVSIIYGRVSINSEGKGNYMGEPKLKPADAWSAKSAGVTCSPTVKTSARIMMVTSLAYAIIQGPAFAEDCGRGTVCERKGEQHWWAFSGVIVCLLAFTGYLIYEIRLHDSMKHHHFEDEAAEEEERTGLVPAHHLPEHVKTLPDVDKLKYLKRSAWITITGGLALIMVLTDPMVDALSEFSKRIKIPTFYVAFVLAPLASSSLEIVAACRYAAKQTTKTTTISLASIVGAACMNNTFCLAIFLVLVFVKNLAWEFAAETLSIVFVQLIVGLIAQRTLFRLSHAYLLLALYPVAIMIVVVLEAWGLN